MSFEWSRYYDRRANLTLLENLNDSCPDEFLIFVSIDSTITPHMLNQSELAPIGSKEFSLGNAHRRLRSRTSPGRQRWFDVRGTRAWLTVFCWL